MKSTPALEYLGSPRLVVAYDSPDRNSIADMAIRLKDLSIAKIGLEPFTAHGTDLVKLLVSEGVTVLLDLKIHDIPRTAGAAAREAKKLGAVAVTAHAAGGLEMIEAVSEEIPVFAVTVLTSIDKATAEHVGWHGEIKDIAGRLGDLAMVAGASGLVCSANELGQLAAFGGLRLVPGIRPLGVVHDDQKRVATPEDAVAAGANWIVMGRPILQARDPVAAAEAVVESIGGAR